MTHESFCMKCFSVLPADAASCPVCGQDVTAFIPREYREKLIHALQHPLADVRMRVIIALGLRRDTAAAAELVACALRHPTDVVEGLEIVRSLRMLPEGVLQRMGLQTLREQHPATIVRKAAMTALAEDTPHSSTP